jgi:hypothetical protein
MKDNRCKLTQEQKAEIIALPLKNRVDLMVLQRLLKNTGYPKEFNFILDPKKLEDNRILAKERKKLKISSLELG